MSWNRVLVLFCLFVLVVKLYLTLCNPMDCSPPGSSLYRISQVRIREWVAISFSREPSWPRVSNPHLVHWQADPLPMSHQGREKLQGVCVCVCVRACARVRGWREEQVEDRRWVRWMENSITIFLSGNKWHGQMGWARVWASDQDLNMACLSDFRQFLNLSESAWSPTNWI